MGHLELRRSDIVQTAAMTPLVLARDKATVDGVSIPLSKS